MRHLQCSIRSCTIKYEGPPGEDDKENITRSLLRAGAEKVQFTGNQCRVHYPFPALTMDLIFRLLSSTNTVSGARPVRRCYDLWMSFLENNEQSHLVHSGGWRCNVEDVYIRYFNQHRIEREDIRKQTWRKYKQG